MSLDFKEIPPANKADGNQDRFEQFACDFLETMGFKIIERPFRGADGKKDIIVVEERPGIENTTRVKWLVSCKHKAHSKRGVSDRDESDILDRVKTHDCNGFLGIYSTSPTTTLATKFFNLSKEIECVFYDPGRLEREIRISAHKTRIIQTYFPNSYNPLHDDSNEEKSPQEFSKETMLEAAMTAMILLKLEKIKEKILSVPKDKDLLDKLYRYVDYSNEKIAENVFHILEKIATRTRNGQNKSSEIFGLVLTFFPSSHGEAEKRERIINGEYCANIGFVLAYDSFIYLKNYSAAVYGLLILKFIYREGNQNDMPELVKKVKRLYVELENHLDRPERNDLGNAKKMLQIFKYDLDTYDLAFPPLPAYLYKLIQE